MVPPPSCVQKPSHTFKSTTLKVVYRLNKNTSFAKSSRVLMRQLKRRAVEFQNLIEATQEQLRTLNIGKQDSKACGTRKLDFETLPKWGNFVSKFLDNPEINALEEEFVVLHLDPLDLVFVVQQPLDVIVSSCMVDLKGLYDFCGFDDLKLSDFDNI